MAGTVVAVVLVLTVLGGRADAADYDSRGLLHTTSGATAVVDLRCGPYGGSVGVNFGANTPDYIAMRVVNANTGQWATPWTDWEAVTTRNIYLNNLLATRGNWRLAVQIADWNGWAWTFDTEYTYITNTVWGYGDSYCHI